jgi:hypothetical protein
MTWNCLLLRMQMLRSWDYRKPIGIGSSVGLCCCCKKKKSNTDANKTSNFYGFTYSVRTASSVIGL